MHGKVSNFHYHVRNLHDHQFLSDQCYDTSTIYSQYLGRPTFHSIGVSMNSGGAYTFYRGLLEACSDQDDPFVRVIGRMKEGWWEGDIKDIGGFQSNFDEFDDSGSDVYVYCYTQQCHTGLASIDPPCLGMTQGTHTSPVRDAWTHSTCRACQCEGAMVATNQFQV